MRTSYDTERALTTPTRQAEVADLPAVAGIDQAVYGADSYTEMTMRQHFDVAGPLFSVATDGDAVVGYALVVPTFRRHEAYFMSLVVAERHRGRGLGRALVERSLQTCDDMGFSAVRLTVDAGNDIAIKLYSTFSFTKLEQVRGYFGKDKDRLVLVRGKGPTGDG